MSGYVAPNGDTRHGSTFYLRTPDYDRGANPSQWSGRLPDLPHRSLPRYGGAAGLDDDIAALLIRREGEPAPGGSRLVALAPVE